MPTRWNAIYNKLDLTGTPSGEIPVTKIIDGSGTIVEANGDNEIQLTNGQNISIVGNVPGHSLAVGVTGQIPVANGGTGAATLTDHGFVFGSGTNPVTVSAAPTDGQIPIGVTGGDSVLAQLTEGAGIAITNAPGSVTIAAKGGGGSTSIASADVWCDFVGGYMLSVNGTPINGSALTPTNSESGHPGVLVSNGSNPSAYYGYFNLATGDIISTTIFKCTDDLESGDGICVGLVSDTTPSSLTDGIYFRAIYNDGDTVNWSCVSEKSDVKTVTSTSNAINNGWYKFQIKTLENGTKAQFYVNNVLLTEHTTNIPLTTTQLFSGIVSASLSSQSVYIDYIGTYQPLTR